MKLANGNVNNIFGMYDYMHVNWGDGVKFYISAQTCK